MKLLTYKDVPFAPAQVTPGEILLEEFLKPRRISQTTLSRWMNINSMRINLIIRGKRAISAETAILLGGVLGTSAHFWLKLQDDHDLALAALQLGPQQVG